MINIKPRDLASEWGILWTMKMSNLNTFTAIVDLVDLIFQSCSFSLNQLTWQETCTAASVYLADIIFIPSVAYYAYIAI